MGNLTFGQQGNITKDTAFSFVEQMPEFPDGQAALQKFLKDNLKYPNIAKDSGIEGKVLVQFVVTKEGKLEKISVVRGIGSGCDEEAMRLILIMPRWKPAKNNNLPVSFRYTLPITFKLK